MTAIPLARPQTTARIAGALYLVIIVGAGFAEVTRTRLVVPGNATATAANIMASEGAFRLAFATDLVAFLADVALALVLFVLFRPVHGTLSLLAAGFRMAQASILGINLLNHLGAILLLGGATYLAAFPPDQLNALALLSMDAHKYGYNISGTFFGVHCLMLGWLLYASRWVPRVLGVLLAVAGAAYLADSFTSFVAPRHEALMATVVVAPAAVAELSLCFWLLLKGVRVPGALPATRT